jgi:hypothetical protein
MLWRRRSETYTNAVGGREHEKITPADALLDRNEPGSMLALRGQRLVPLRFVWDLRGRSDLERGPLRRRSGQGKPRVSDAGGRGEPARSQTGSGELRDQVRR